MTTQQIFDTGVAEGLDKNDIMMKLVSEGGLSVIEAVREYNSLAKACGMIASLPKRLAYLQDNLDYGTASDQKAKRVFVESYAKEFDLSLSTASQDILRWAHENNIDLPQATRNSLEDLVSFVKTELDNGSDRETTVAHLQAELGYTEKSANSAYSRALRELGIASRRGPAVPVEDLVSTLREYVDDGYTGAEIVDSLVEKFGYAKTTAQTFLTQLRFAQEYARQEQGA